MQRPKWARIKREAVLIMDPSATTYSVAKMVKVNQSTVWRDLAIRLKDEDPELWSKVQGVLKNNRRGVKRISMDKSGNMDYNGSVNQ